VGARHNKKEIKSSTIGRKILHKNKKNQCAVETNFFIFSSTLPMPKSKELA